MNDVAVLEPAFVFRYVGGTVAVPEDARTLAGFRSWVASDHFPERGRICFLDGKVEIDMSPEDIDAHGQVKAEVGNRIYALNRKLKLGKYFPDRTLLTNDEANLSTEPDSVFALRKTLQSGRLIKVPFANDETRAKELRGTPDWLLEVISDGSVTKDRKTLRRLYFLAGVPEYWLVDARGEEIEFEILIRGETDYESAPVVRGGWQLSSVFRRLFRLLRVQDGLGGWDYTLQMKKPRSK